VVSQGSNINLASAWKCKATHKFEDSGTHQKILLDSVTPSTLQPRSSTLRFPPIWSREGCNLPYKVWDWWWCDLYSGNFTIWAGQGMVLRKCT
jgi:hypothetical protein